jgi:hypothetical protein
VDFICACLLIFLWIVRPQDIFSIISGVSLVKYLMYAGIIFTIRRPAGLNASKMFATPIDWMVTAYCAWAIYATPDHTGAFKEVFTYFSFHVVTALAITSWEKIEKYINIWLSCLAVLAVLAVSQHWGFELVKGSAELTAAFHDRLTLNTWIFRNPNALGHGVLALIPAGIAWYVMAGGKNKVLGIAMIVLAVHCVLLTESKGAFLAGAGGLTLLFLFKRPVWFQVAMLVFVYGAGLAALKALPRMDTLSKDDEGIQGRMIVWQQAKAAMENTSTGEGLKAFQGYVSIRVAKLHRTIHIPIATHGSYVRHGADLGYVGVMLYVGIFYAGARTLLQAKTVPGSEAQRAQRAIYALLATTAISSWVVDRAYHMDYFLLSGLLSAFHRRFKPPEKIEGEEEQMEKTNSVSATGMSSAALSLPVNHAGPEIDASSPAKAPTGQVSTVSIQVSDAELPNVPARAHVSEVNTSPETPAPTRVPARDAAAALAGLSAAPSGAPAGSVVISNAEEVDGSVETRPDEYGAIMLKWDRLTWVDIVVMYLLMEVVLYYWDLFSTDFIVF